MGKVLKIAAVVAAVAVNFIPGVGQAISGAILSTIGTSFAAAGIVSAALGAVSALGMGFALSTAAKALGLGPKRPQASQSQIDRLRASIDPSTPRKIGFGTTALSTDIRYQEWTGSDQEYLDMILAVASHKVEAIDELWLDDKKAWSASGGVTSDFAGYLTVATRLEGTSANYVTISAKWGSTRRLTGIAYLHLRFKVTGNSKKAESPFSSAVPSRMTVRGKGALLYDPRRDSTVGGSGTMRANDQSTWAFTSGGTELGRNPALQLLWYLLGWKIAGKLAVGRGVPADRIDMASFIAAANACDEAVALAAGGTEPRYRTDGVFSEGDAPGLVFESLLASMNGVLRDAGGKLALTVIGNDLGSPVIDFTEDDVIGAFVWDQTPSIEQTHNIVRGRYTNPSDAALYQLVDYPAVSLASIDGIDRILPVDFPLVQSSSQAQRLAKQILQREQYPGTFAAEFKARGWAVQVGDPVRLTFPALGFSTKLFRVVEHAIRVDGIVPMVLREEHSSIYAWSASEVAAVTPAAPTTYDPLNNPLVGGVGDAGLSANWSGVVDDDGNRPENNATVGAPAGTPIGSTLAEEIEARVLLAIDASGFIINGQTLAARIAGQLADAQIAALAASKVTGQLTNAQIADLAAAKITGTLADSQLAAIAAAKVTGQIATTQIADGGITTPKLAAGAVTTNELGANAVTAAKIAAGTITATELASGSVTTAKLVAGSVTTNELGANAVTTAKLAAGAVTTNELAANSVTAAKIVAGTITGDRLVANTITATQLATSGLITLSAQIADAVIISAKIADLAVGTLKIDGQAVTNPKIADNAVTEISSVFADFGWSVPQAGTYYTVDNGFDAAEVSIDTGSGSTQQVFVDAICAMNRAGSSDDTINVRCRREDGTILAQVWSGIRVEGVKQSQTFSFLDPSPTANHTHTYELQINSNDNTVFWEVMMKAVIGKK